MRLGSVRENGPLNGSHNRRCGCAPEDVTSSIAWNHGKDVSSRTSHISSSQDLSFPSQIATPLFSLSTFKTSLSTNFIINARSFQHGTITYYLSARAASFSPLKSQGIRPKTQAFYESLCEKYNTLFPRNCKSTSKMGIWESSTRWDGVCYCCS